jgi:phosphopantetheinyl transferase (holo-ACP synthase)
LHGEAETVAKTLGVRKVLVTLTHTATAAAASAVLLGEN